MSWTDSREKVIIHVEDLLGRLVPREAFHIFISCSNHTVAQRWVMEITCQAVDNTIYVVRVAEDGCLTGDLR
ncbi:MAG: hypothetical protein D6691_05115 [Candidatus Hydrogenedentota bacterium]|nr:MAG: hypothetical protein D6691_05115 [Candidatus Hydrogenedentota bacterium]